jgi:hypothetical protein
MKKIAPIRFKFVYMDSPESQRRMTIAYGRIFELARKKLVLESLSTLEYINSNEAERGISDTRGSSGKIEGQEDHYLPDVPGGKNPSGEVWESMADKQPVTYGIVTRKGD